ncbi:MAG TPA: hypothetical protein PLO33_03360 [Kouleothrix sp.]|uniref:hypothetical protein n=1 Tax=Kouleothrix sp. TaxID=2779161 RepID=UPI002CF9D94B|nr:hypothetical protein [Kouleothrix sp.]HRC74688.1 hypothetical protein [Kouleothrix sp.]
MRYTIRRISVGSALRTALLLGWLVALCPALCLAGVALQVLRRVSAALGQIQAFDISVLGQRIATIDLVALLGLSGAAQTTAQLAGRAGATFALFALVLTLAGAAVFVGAALLCSVGYNLLARLAGGIEVELREPR